ncbi:MAG: single-stranded DNA-binding protein [Candidatus Sabulitectum sp.]|nr:single-stranded DNA-binding protein [Candidatus Sabulitectum sp.]
MSFQKDLPGLNYAVVTGVIQRRKALSMTRSGVPVLHLLVETIVESYPGSEEDVVAEIEVDVWGNLARDLDPKLQEGDAVLVEGRLAHRKSEDRTGGEHYKTLLRARRIVHIFKKERKA